MKYTLRIPLETVSPYGYIGFKIEEAPIEGIKYTYATQEVDTEKDQLADVVQGLKQFLPTYIVEIKVGQHLIILRAEDPFDNHMSDDGTVHLMMLTEAIAIAAAIGFDTMSLRKAWMSLHKFLLTSNE